MAAASALRAMLVTRSPGRVGRNDRTRGAPQKRTGWPRRAARPAPLTAVAAGKIVTEVTCRQACADVPAAKTAKDTDVPGRRVSAVFCAGPCS